MKKSITFLLLSLSLCFSGCIVVLLGTGVTAGIAVSKDSAELNKDTTFANAWKITHDVIESRGKIDLQSETGGTIKATVDETKISATITQLTPKTVHIRIKARKYFFPRVSVAVDILTAIHDQLK